MSVHPTPLMKRRLNIWAVLALTAFAAVIVFEMLQVTVVDSALYEEKANENQFGSIIINANRGGIYDRNGKILAQSATVFDVVLNAEGLHESCVQIDPKTEEKIGFDQKLFDEVVDMLAEKLALERDFVLEKANNYDGSGRNYQVLKSKVEKPLADEVQRWCLDQKLNCITPVENTKRYYPQGDLAASVIGFVGGDGNGQYGLEARYNDYLSGINGRIITAQDAFHQQIPDRYSKEFAAREGNSLELTLDMTLQYYLEKHLQTAVSTYKAQNRACGIIMNPRTGEIYAMASVPGFDLNDYGSIYDPAAAAELAAMPRVTEQDKEAYTAKRAELWEKQWKNKAITELYYPGSVFKVITGAAAIEEKVVTNTERSFTCTPMSVYGTNFHCWKLSHPHGTQILGEAMTNSCNPAFIQIGERLGISAFSRFYAAFGFTEGTGVDLPGEVQTSLYYREERMGPVELASSSFGQTNKVTPIQMITAYAATINGGYLVTPYVVSKIKDSDGNVILSNDTVVRRQVISEESSAIMREMLESVVNTNGGSNAYIKGYRIGGKSGTSEKQEENLKQNRDDLYVASYVGFAPADDPEMIALVMVDEPSTGEYYGSVIAVPVVIDVFKEALPYLGYYPEYSEEELANMDISLQTVEGLSVEAAKSKLEADDLICEVIGGGETVVAQVPSRGSSVPRKGRVILYTDEDYKEEYVTVPDLIGQNYNLSAANSVLANAHLNLKADGATKRADAIATRQNYEAGALVPKGTIIEVGFAVHDQTG